MVFCSSSAVKRREVCVLLSSSGLATERKRRELAGASAEHGVVSLWNYLCCPAQRHVGGATYMPAQGHGPFLVILSMFLSYGRYAIRLARTSI